MRKWEFFFLNRGKGGRGGINGNARIQPQSLIKPDSMYSTVSKDSTIRKTHFPHLACRFQALAIPSLIDETCVAPIDSFLIRVSAKR
jgi:hypothetical protein